MSILTVLRKNKSYIRTLRAFTVLLLYGSHVVSAQTPTEEQVKAVYIYNLVNFVEWPETAFEKSSGSFVIGVAGSETYSRLIEHLVRGETYKGRTIEVRHIGNQEDGKACHILFIDRTCQIANQLISQTHSRPVLTVSETDNFMEDGGMVRFFVDESKVRIEINQKLSSDHNILISSKLLRLSKIYNRQ